MGGTAVFIQIGQIQEYKLTYNRQFGTKEECAGIKTT
jgi:hypothetical protein